MIEEGLEGHRTPGERQFLLPRVPNRESQVAKDMIQGPELPSLPSGEEQCRIAGPSRNGALDPKPFGQFLSIIDPRVGNEQISATSPDQGLPVKIVFWKGAIECSAETDVTERLDFLGMRSKSDQRVHYGPAKAIGAAPTTET